MRWNKGLLTAALVLIAGSCAHVSVEQKDRTDTGITGNAGYLTGNAQTPPDAGDDKKTKDMLNVSMENPVRAVKKADDWIKKNLW